MGWGRIRQAITEGSAKNARVSKKIAILRAEGVPQKQAVATALSMERAGRIRADGSYERVKESFDEDTGNPHLRRDVACIYCGAEPGKGHNLFYEHGRSLDESIEDAARDMLNYGSHEGPCVHDMPNGACSLHWAAMARREEVLRRELGEETLLGSPQAVRKTRTKRRKMYHPHLKRGYRSEWHHKAPGVQHDRQHAPNANGPWMHRHYGSHGEVVGSWHAPGVHETVTSGSVGTGPATALGATTPAPAVNPAATQAPHAPPLASVRPNWSQANKQRFAPRGNKRQARIVYRGYSPKV